ncbi:PrpF domain-containing protein [Nonomuraea jabiensis]|uniref:PrpF domain-containing protein n=1 Tax=Nonomuraea jabiensis TaxID=882448 RepID=UPI0034154306
MTDVRTGDDDSRRVRTDATTTGKDDGHRARNDATATDDNDGHRTPPDVTTTGDDGGVRCMVMRGGTSKGAYFLARDLPRDPRERVQSLRVRAGKLMGLGDVTGEAVPKTTLVAPPRDGGALCTRTFVPVRPHTAIGVLDAVSVVTSALLPNGVARRFARLPEGARVDVEHPTGLLQVEVELDLSSSPSTAVRAANVRTARKLFDGTVFPRPRG